MPPARFAALIAIVLAAAALTLWIIGFAAPSGLTPVLAILPLVAALAVLFWRRRS